jgi:phenylacetate-coenzyme A ligase PaaK-like adenylate-forming protein
MAAIREELERDPIGYMTASPWSMEELTQSIEPAVLKQAGLAMWLSFSGSVDPKLREAFASLGIPVRTNYSAEEVGPIGFECVEIPGNYHVATSNVIVEVSDDDALQVGDLKLGRVLVTHLHSYATPFIRYDLGDVAVLAPQCACGHDGPTLSHVYGRSKNLLKRSDGTVLAFALKGPELAKIGKFTEFRIMQTGLQNIVLEIGGRTSLEPKETEQFAALIKLHAGPDFAVEVRPVAEIDWGASTKRLGFYNALL